MYFMLYMNILLIVNMKTFYMHHYLCIVQCVDEKKKIRCTLLNINAKQRNAKIKIKNTNNISCPVCCILGFVVVSFRVFLCFSFGFVHNPK